MPSVKAALETTEVSTPLCCERCFGKTMRRIHTPSGDIGGRAQAKYADGLLELKPPKSNGAPNGELSIPRVELPMQ